MHDLNDPPTEADGVARAPLQAEEEAAQRAPAKGRVRRDGVTPVAALPAPTPSTPAPVLLTIALLPGRFGRVGGAGHRHDGERAQVVGAYQHVQRAWRVGRGTG
jgi:hypothetical protein